MNTNLQNIKDNFESSTLINTASLIPLPAGTKEIFTYVPENVNIPNGTAIFFAIIAVDKSFQKSDVSNIAQSVFYNVPLPPILLSTTTKVNSATTTNNTPKFTTNSTSAYLFSSPPGESTTTKPSIISISASTKPSTHPSTTLNTLGLVIVIVCAVLILICLLVCFIICICCRRRTSQHKHMC